MQTPTAKLIEENGKIIVKTSAYNADFVAEIKEVPGKKPVFINGKFDAWSAPVEQEQAVREVVRRYFQIEGEESHIEYEVLRLRVTGKSSARRSYCGGVSIDGHELIDTMRGGLRTSPHFEVLKNEGGFVYGDGYVNPKRQSSHAFKVEYIVEIKVRKGAKIEANGHGECWGSVEILGGIEKESSSDDEDPTFTFGKYEGSKLSDVSSAYLRWLVVHVNVLTKEHQEFVKNVVKTFLAQEDTELTKAA